jgi:hypothetical protein
MGTNCAPLLADLFLYSYESEFLQKLVKNKKIHEARAFNFTYRYIDDVLMTFQEIRIIATGPCIANQFRDVNTICRRSWYIAAHLWKIYDQDLVEIYSVSAETIISDAFSYSERSQEKCQGYFFINV